MTVPGRVEAARLLCSLDPPGWFLRHSLAVADIAAWLAARIAGRTAIDRPAVEAAALLHDVDKLLPRDDPARRLPHGEGSGAWLDRLGHGELAPLVAAHPVTRLQGAACDRWLVDGPLEERVVAYADKRAGQRLESMDARFASWARRYPPATDGRWDATARAAIRDRAARLEAGVCAAAGVSPAEVGRLRWSGREIERASGR